MKNSKIYIYLPPGECLWWSEIEDQIHRSYDALVQKGHIAHLENWWLIVKGKCANPISAPLDRCFYVGWKLQSTIDGLTYAPSREVYYCTEDGTKESHLEGTFITISDHGLTQEHEIDIEIPVTQLGYIDISWKGIDPINKDGDNVRG